LVEKAFIFKSNRKRLLRFTKLSNLESNRSLAGIGALMLFLSFIPFLGIIGLILLLIGMKGLADYYKEPNIYQNALMGVIFGIIGIIAATVLLFGVIIGGMFSVFSAGIGAAIGGILVFILVLVVAFVFLLLAAMYFRRGLSSLAMKSGEHMFETAGMLLLVGAILTVVLVGFLLMWIASLLLAVAFFSMKTSPPSTYNAPSPPLTTSTMQATRYCPNCGAPVQPNTIYCPNCGKQLPP
jgi:uncharacterized membrane protein